MRADYVLDYDVVSRARAHRLYLLVRVQGGSAAGSVQRPPLNLSVVLDKSGSMRGDKIAYVKQAAQFLVQHLGPDDLFSLVTYDTSVNVDLEPAPVVYKDRVSQRIEQIRAGTSTNLSGGWLQGCTLVAQHHNPRAINRVLLLTDGLANVGITDHGQLAGLAGQKRGEGVTTTTMGVGEHFNEDLLRSMAHDGGGAYYFIDSPDRAPEIFRAELSDLLRVVGQNLHVTITPTRDVPSIRQLNTYASERRGAAVRFAMGDLYADEVKVLLLELEIPALDTLGQVEVARLHVEYDALSSSGVQHQTSDIPVIVNTVPEDQVGVHTARPNDEVRRAALLLGAARARETAVGQADGGNFGAANETLVNAAQAIDAYFASGGAPDDQLVQQRDMLREEAIDMEFGSERYDSLSRKFSTSKIPTGAASGVLRDDQLNETVVMHQRMKSSRRALERQGKPPTGMVWRGEQRDLTGVDVLTFGRGDECDVRIDDESVSQEHCRITREGDQLYLEDLNATNGTFANGGRLGKGRFRLSAGDIVTVGTVLFTFR